MLLALSVLTEKDTKHETRGQNRRDGVRGRRGKRGATGLVGRRGQTGKPGEKGLKGPQGPLDKNDILKAVVTHFDDVYRQLHEQMRRMTEIQQQVHVLIGRDGALTVTRSAKTDPRR